MKVTIEVMINLWVVIIAIAYIGIGSILIWMFTDVGEIVATWEKIIFLMLWPLFILLLGIWGIVGHIVRFIKR